FLFLCEYRPELKRLYFGMIPQNFQTTLPADFVSEAEFPPWYLPETGETADSRSQMSSGSDISVLLFQPADIRHICLLPPAYIWYSHLFWRLSLCSFPAQTAYGT